MSSDVIISKYSMRQGIQWRFYRRISTMDGRVLRENCGDKKESPQEDTGEPIIIFDRKTIDNYFS